MPDAYYLSRRGGRVRQRTKQIESCVYAKFAPDASHARRRPMINGREHKTDANLAQTFFGDFGLRSDFDAERCQNVCAAGTTRCRAAAMLCYWKPCSGYYKRCRCRDIESLGVTRACARSVYKTGMLATDSHCARAHGLSHPCQLINRLALDCQRNQSSGDLRIRSFAIEQSIEQHVRLIAPQILAPHQTQQERAQTIISLRFISTRRSWQKPCRSHKSWSQESEFRSQNKRETGSGLQPYPLLASDSCFSKFQKICEQSLSVRSQN